MSTLAQLCRSAITRAEGNTERALELFDNALVKENSAPLERELCSAYRKTAMRACIATHYNELRAEGKFKLRGEYDTPIRTQPFNPLMIPDNPKRWRPGLGVNQDLRPSAEAMNNALILNAFKVNGEPIGDCTVPQVEAAANVRERDARFMRLLISGLPPVGKIREYRTDDEADEIWKRAQQ